MLAGQDASESERKVLAAICERDFRVAIGQPYLYEALAHAHRMSPFYRERWQVPPPHNRIELFEWFYNLPYTTKADLSVRLLDLCADDLTTRFIFRHETSGTTGEPVTAIIDEHDWHMNLVAMYLKFRQLCDLGNTHGRWGFLQVTIYPIGSAVQIQTPLPGAPYWRRVNVPATKEYLPKVLGLEKISRVLAQSPTILNGLPTGLLYLSQFAKRAGLKLEPPLLVVTSGDPLTEDVRTRLEDRFRAPVYSFYSAGEVGNIGFECPRKNGFHVENHRVFIEVAKSGEVIATALDNPAMPLIRYRTGDYTAWKSGECDCGDKRPMFASIIGRSQEAYFSLVEQAFGFHRNVLRGRST